MSYIAWIIAIVGMCIELAGLLGYGMSWTLSGALVTVIGGVFWGICPTKSRSS